ncbi:MAG TPA: DUF459 domain-containing protein [Acidimicrobiales bacterium]|nr:DUF459 domain-containing protein [Acidimicrobiales bacterium]
MDATRRWPLRVGLATALLALVVSGVSLTRPGAKAPSTSTSATSSTTTTTSTRSTTPTTTLVAPFLEAGSTAGPFASFRALRGCGLHQLDPTSPTSSSTSVSSTVASRVRTTPLRHCRILEIGDSIGADLGWGLQREISSVPGLDLVQADVSSTGLAATWYYNWPEHFKHLLARYRPNLVVVCLGANDQQGMSRSGHAVSFATMDWRNAYRGNIDQILSLARRAGAYVLWVGLPVMRPTTYNQGVTLLNSLYAERVRLSAGAVFISTSSLLATPTGGYRASARVGSRVEVLRATDGIHFSVIGENVLATYVVKAIAASFHVPLAPRHPMGISG